MTKAAILGKMLTWLCTCGHMLDHSSGLVQPHNLCRFGTDPPTQQCSEKGTLCPHCEEARVVATGRQEVDAPSEDSFQDNMLGPILIGSKTNLDCNAHAHNAQIYISWGLWTWHIAFFCQIRKGRPQYSKIKLRTQEEEKLHAQMLKCISLYKYISIARVSFEKVIDFWVGGKFPLGTERATLLRLLSVTALLSDNQRGEKMTGTLSQRPQNTQSCFFYNPEWFFGFRPYLRSLYIRKSQRKVQK